MGQRLTQFLAIASVTMAVGLYASTVHSQKIWGKEYAKLVQLQDDESRFIATSESLKEQVVEQTKTPEVGLVPASPNQNLYIHAPKTVALRPQTPPKLKPIENNAPIGY